MRIPRTASSLLRAFDRTYEGLKPRFYHLGLNLPHPAFDRTYEGLKPGGGGP